MLVRSRQMYSRVNCHIAYIVVLTMPDPPPIKNGSSCFPTAAGVDIDLSTWIATSLFCAAIGNWTVLYHNDSLNNDASILSSSINAVYLAGQRRGTSDQTP